MNHIITDEDIEIVEDCLYGLIETWNLKTKWEKIDNKYVNRVYNYKDENLLFTG